DSDEDFVGDACDRCPGFDDTDPANPCERLFSVAATDDQLRLLDPASGTTLSSVRITLPGETVAGATGLATHPLTGELWALLRLARADNQRQLVVVDPTTGFATSIG